jgi:hypothetical protein
MSNHIGRQLGAALSGVLLLGCASAPVSQAASSGLPMDVRIVSVPESKGESRLRFATWALVVGTIGGFLYAARRQSADMRESIAAATKAAEAAQRSADLATQPAQQASKDRRDALIRETTLAIHRLVYTASSVRKLAETVPKATAELFTLSGRASAIRAGELPGSGAAVERTSEADAMAKNASSILASDWRTQSDDQIASTLVLMESHLEKLKVTKEDILRDLSQIETDKSAVRASMLAGRFRPGAI